MKFGLYTLQIESTLTKIPIYQRIFDFGWGNGYVLLPHNHPFYGKHYDDIGVVAHGGLTFSDYLMLNHFLEWIGDREFDGDVTLENYKKFDKWWMIGFDTAHAGDDSYVCSKEFVINETHEMIEQCLSDDIKGMNLYKAIYLRKDKLKLINASMSCNE